MIVLIPSSYDGIMYLNKGETMAPGPDGPEHALAHGQRRSALGPLPGAREGRRGVRADARCGPSQSPRAALLMILLDTNVVSALIHRIPGALSQLRMSEPVDVVLCSPVAAEIHYGLSRLASGSRRRLVLAEEHARLREAVAWVDWTEAAATEFGRQKALLEARREPIEDMDIAIGSVALTIGAGVATYDARHLERLKGLSVDDWGESAGA